MWLCPGFWADLGAPAGGTGREDLRETALPRLGKGVPAEPGPRLPAVARDVIMVDVSARHREDQGKQSVEDIVAGLLVRNLEVSPSDRVLVFSCGAGLLGAAVVARAAPGEVVLADSNVASFEATRRALAANGAADATVYLSAGSSHIPPGPAADVAVIRVPKGRLPTRQLIWDAFHALRPGGRCYLAGANDEGIRPALEQVELLFGNGTVLDYRKGCRVGSATKLADGPGEGFDAAFLDHNTFYRYSCEARGKTYVVCSRPGVFSWEKLDDGTRALIEGMEIWPGERVLDLGCGAGIVGVVVADFAGDVPVCLVDAEIDAVDSAIETTRANGKPECVVLPSDSAAAVRDQRFDVVVCNPPFHVSRAATYEVAIRFIEDAARVLRRSGRFYLVANRFLPYEEHLGRCFAAVETVFRDSRYKVLRAARPQPTARSTTLMCGSPPQKRGTQSG